MIIKTEHYKKSSICVNGYPGLTLTADQIALYIPHCKIYCEPLAGLGRVAKLVSADRMILNDMSDFAIEYLKKNFPNAEVIKGDYIDCIKKYDSVDTFFLIDPPYRTSAYALNQKTFIDRTDTTYFTEIRDLLPTLKGNFIMCSDSSRTGARIYKDTPYYKTIVEGSKQKLIFGKTSKILLISNLPFNAKKTESEEIMEMF